MPRFPLRNLRLRPGEEARETVRVTLEPFVLGGESYVATPSVVPAELTVQRAVSGHVFRLDVAARVVGPCMRCLTPAAIEVAVDAQEYEAAAPSGDEELRSGYVADEGLDVDGWARDLVALALPEPILCRPDCAGLCPVCGKNLNEEPHTHDEVSTDPRWAALEALRGSSPDDD